MRQLLERAELAALAIVVGALGCSNADADADPSSSAPVAQSIYFHSCVLFFCSHCSRVTLCVVFLLSSHSGVEFLSLSISET
jgi:hypothetical protein